MVNTIVLAWIMIMNSVAKDLLSGVVYSTDALQLWKALSKRFDKPYGT